MTTTQGLALIRMAIVIPTVIIMWRQKNTPSERWLSAPILAWIVNTGIYLIVLLIDSMDNQYTMMGCHGIWSNAIQIQGLLTILLIEIVRWSRKRKVALVSNE